MRTRITVLLFVILLAGCGTTEDRSTVQKETVADSEPGELVYKQTCVGCHGQDLDGRGSSMKDLRHIGSKLSEEDIKNVVINGRRSMPSGLVKDDEELDALVKWLHSHK
ncbi:c-type cytochrome [Phocicoccus pinnipedialis]|uniref:Cytochrome c-551 n=1 Tax=Phocicoccus pinnipedialis TaxID=110845 RepID=A0A6V7R166_9BACL|nr:cytochrome c [Jeotgalicoccus pinnipedialis]MBP1938784.1 mono/diheme cytochrome c family protein [Jeotgalicoccus pinnipedialis]CAD2070804.1 Cytochrome c-551 precursor [Jeotgalicoccus pinnipedialis]